MFWPWGGHLAYSSTNLSNLSITSPIFSTVLRTQLKLLHLSIVNLPQCVCTHPIDPMGIHLLCCAHGNECMGTHDAIHNTFATIARDVGFHMGQLQLHALPSTTHIVLTKDEICTLINFVMANPTRADLLPQGYTTPGFVAFNAIQTKEKSYCD